MEVLVEGWILSVMVYTACVTLLSLVESLLVWYLFDHYTDIFAT